MKRVQSFPITRRWATQLIIPGVTCHQSHPGPAASITTATATSFTDGEQQPHHSLHKVPPSWDAVDPDRVKQELSPPLPQLKEFAAGEWTFNALVAPSTRYRRAQGTRTDLQPATNTTAQSHRAAWTQPCGSRKQEIRKIYCFCHPPIRQIARAHAHPTIKGLSGSRHVVPDTVQSQRSPASLSRDDTPQLSPCHLVPAPLRGTARQCFRRLATR